MQCHQILSVKWDRQALALDAFTVRLLAFNKYLHQSKLHRIGHQGASRNRTSNEHRTTTLRGFCPRGCCRHHQSLANGVSTWYQVLPDLDPWKNWRNKRSLWNSYGSVVLLLFMAVLTRNGNDGGSNNAQNELEQRDPSVQIEHVQINLNSFASSVKITIIL